MACFKRWTAAIAPALLIAVLAGCSDDRIDGDSTDAADDRTSEDASDARSGRDASLADLGAEDVVADASVPMPDGVNPGGTGDGSVLVDSASEGGPADGTHDALDETGPADAAADLGRNDGDAFGDSIGPQVDGGACTGTIAGAIDLSRAVSDAANIYFIHRSACAIQAVPKAGGLPVTLVQMTTPINDLAVSAGHVYFTTSSAVHKCALAGCGNVPTAVASAQGGDRIVTDGSAVYFTSGGRILKCSVNGCGASAEVFAAFATMTSDIVTDGTTLFWSDLAVDPTPRDGGPYRYPSLSWCPLAGCVGMPQSQFIYVYAPSTLSTDGTALFWASSASSGSISMSSINPSGLSPPTELAKSFQGLLGATFAGNGSVYWWDASKIFSCTTPTCRRTSSQFVAGENAGPSVVASDTSAFYWFERSTSTFHQCPLTGCSGTALDAVDAEGIHPPDVAASDDLVLWLEGQAGGAAVHLCSRFNCTLTDHSIADGTGTFSGLISSGAFRYFFEGCGPGEACYLRRAPNKTAASGTVSGMAYGAPLTLRLNTGGSVVETLQLAADGPFAFQYAIAGGESYDVEIEPATPVGCRSTTSSGVIGGGDVTSVVFSCPQNLRLVGGSVTGLEGDSVVLQNNGVDIVQMNGDGQFAFPTPLAPGADYDVTVRTQLKFRGACQVANGKGKTSTTSDPPLDVLDVAVTCVARGDAGPRSSGLIADSQYLYWVQGGELSGGNIVNGAVVRMALDGGPIEPLATALAGIGGSSTAIDVSNVYFSALGSGTINKMPIAGGLVTTLAGGQTAPTSLVINGTTLFWATATDIVSLDLAAPGAMPVSIAASPANGLFASRLGTVGPPRRLICGNGYLYWVSMNAPYQDAVERAGVRGENRTVLVPRQSGLGGGIALAGENVYFSGTLAKLMSVPAL